MHSVAPPRPVVSARGPPTDRSIQRRCPIGRLCRIRYAHSLHFFVPTQRSKSAKVPTGRVPRCSVNLHTSMRNLTRVLCSTATSLRGLLFAAVCIALEGCSGGSPSREPPIDPDAARTQIRQLIPASVQNRDGWAIDMFGAFEALEIKPTTPNICAVIAVAQQESGFQADPVVPGLPAKARDEIDAR